MGALGSGIGMGLGVLGSIFGGISASKAMKKVKNNLNDMRRRNEDWYNRNYNEDATERADAQAALTKITENLRNRNRQVAGVQAVTGGTEESIAAEKAANNSALANTIASIVVNGERRKDAIESRYQAKDDAIQQNLNELEQNKAANISKAISGVAETSANISEIL